ncbi:putative bifunctional diguanylate cyclase/phosphodiesterase [Methylobacterium sp. A54F]
MPADLIRVLDLELAKRGYDRRCPVLTQRYEIQQEQVQREDTRTAIWFVGTLYVLFAITDAVLISDLIVYAVALRVVVGSAYIAAISYQIRRAVKYDLIELQCALGIVLGYTAWLALATLSDQRANVLYYLSFGIVFMMVSNLFFNFRFRIALVTSSMITVVFFTAVCLLVDASLGFYVAIGSLYLLSLILTLFLNWKLNVERYRVFLNALRAETRQKQATERGEELLRLSTTDALTGLRNRRAADQLLKSFWTDWTAEAKAFAVILIDVDYFKMFNDYYGHQQGDACLIAVARAMQGAVADPRCTLGRFGGEEFIVLMPATSAQQVLDTAERIRASVQALAIPHEARSDHLASVTVSVGTAFSQDVTGEKPEKLVTAADRALYWAKDSNRNCVKAFDPSLAANDASSDVVAEAVRTAIEQRRVALAFQPIWNVTTGQIFAAEALMRLTAPCGTPISPGVFIPVAERSGLIVELGAWVIEEACATLLANPELPLISVNVSAVQLMRSRFVEFAAATLRSTGVAPGRLAIEITEGLEIDENPDILDAIEALRALGVNVWLDDFGTGFAGLSCLSKIKFDTIKIDRLFIQASHTPRGAKLLKDIVNLVANSGQNIIVEGVETVEQCDLLRSYGVKYHQGFYFNRPMSADALTLLLNKSRNRAMGAVAA